MAKGPLTNPVMVFHTLCDGVVSLHSLAHCHSSFGREEDGRVGGTGPVIESLFFFFLVCLSTLVYAVSQISI